MVPLYWSKNYRGARPPRRWIPQKNRPEALDDGSERLARSSRWSRLGLGLQVSASSLTLRPSHLRMRMIASHVPRQPVPTREREP